MSSITIPLEGERYMGDKPAIQRIARCTIAAAAADGVDVVCASQATFALFNIPANSLVLEVMAYTPTAWTTSTTLNIGDGTDTDGWLATAKVAPTTAQTNGIMKSSNVATAEALAGGKLYLTADTIDVLVGGATPIVGKTEVLIKYIPDYTLL